MLKSHYLLLLRLNKIEMENDDYLVYHEKIVHGYLTSQNYQFKHLIKNHKHRIKISYTCLVSQFSRYPKCLWLPNLSILYTNSAASTTTCNERFQRNKQYQEAINNITDPTYFNHNGNRNSTEKY